MCDGQTVSEASSSLHRFVRRSSSSRHSWLQRVTYDVSRQAVRLASVSLFSVRAGGRRNLPCHGGALICSNHQSYFDPVLVGLICNRRLNYLARDTLFRSSAFGWLIRWFDAIPIQRDGMGLAGLKETLRRLREGEQVLIFPEGTRTPDGNLQPLKTGISMLAKRARVPLIPVALDGAYQAWPRRQRWPRLSHVYLQVGRPILPEEFLPLSDEALVERLGGRLRDCLEIARRRRGLTESVRSLPNDRHPVVGDLTADSLSIS